MDKIETCVSNGKQRGEKSEESEWLTVIHQKGERLIQEALLRIRHLQQTFLEESASFDQACQTVLDLESSYYSALKLEKKRILHYLEGTDQSNKKR